MRHLSLLELELVSGGLWTASSPDDGGGGGGDGGAGGGTGGTAGGNSADQTRSDDGDRLEVLIEREQVSMFGGFGDAELGSDGNMHVLATTLPTLDQLTYSHNLEVLNSWVLGLRGVQDLIDKGAVDQVIKSIANALTDSGIDAVKSNLNLLSLYQEFKNLAAGAQKTADEFAQFVKDRLAEGSEQPSGGGGGDQFSYEEDYAGWNGGDYWDNWDIGMNDSGPGGGGVMVGTEEDWWNEDFWGDNWDNWFDDFFDWWMGGSY